MGYCGSTDSVQRLGESPESLPYSSQHKEQGGQAQGGRQADADVGREGRQYAGNKQELKKG